MHAMKHFMTMMGLKNHKNSDAIQEKFGQHVSQYGLSYGTTEEFQFRMEQFAMNDKIIQEINSDSENLFTVGHNIFSTYTRDEYKKLLGKKSSIPVGMKVEEEILDVSNLSATVDWRAKGAVNPVQDQGQCGSCWAFSSTAALEGAHFLKTGELLKLGEQQFVDCVSTCYGCNGGLESLAFDYAKKNPQELESDYPYTARDQTCKAVATKEKIQVTSYSAVKSKSFSQLKAAVDAQPTCVSVDAESSAW
jgi:cathepsin L